MVNKEEKGDSEFGVKFFTWVGFILVPLAIVMPFMVIYFDLKDLGDLGPVGDFIGGTTVTFLTGASVFLLIATNIMQRKELQMSRKSIDEMVKQTEASVEQMAASVQQAEEARKETQITNETMKRQQFETTFFNMLQLHHQIVDGIKTKLQKVQEKGGMVNIVEGTYSGREAISELRDTCKRYIAVVSDENCSYNIPKAYIDSFFESNTIEQEKLDKAYELFQERYGNHTGHYMRNNYRIVKFIVENVADNEEEQKKIKEKTGRDAIIGDKRFYFGTLRAQWSDAEFELIFINSLYKKNHKFKKLIRQNDVLDIKKTNETNEEILEDKPEESFVLKEDTILSQAYNSLIEKG
ncbi:putative phage abortive infection protein [Bacillus toyonensis]|uniref:putative phage abortive infection protein n=1 Tax=Bacillus toyonensis TaxID=155322 RepID=UPI0021CEAB64|nr:putative phage abortive infection protein [Bacillus toyonensis]MCU5583118.1 putative phage abortive infection protein [Bacillus toyonensis]